MTGIACERPLGVSLMWTEVRGQNLDFLVDVINGWMAHNFHVLNLGFVTKSFTHSEAFHSSVWQIFNNVWPVHCFRIF